MQASATLLIIGQAPGTKVHETGIPWNDASGDRLRDWIQVSRDDFYDDRKIAIMPMGFCYPGRLPKGGDAPPRAECAPLWHPQLRPWLYSLRLTLLVGAYAQRYYLPSNRKQTMTETVRSFRELSVHHALFPLPHPSWRTAAWQKKNPWFDEEVLPALRARIAEVLA
jgi:uracil-DNA glycosylase